MTNLLLPALVAGALATAAVRGPELTVAEAITLALEHNPTVAAGQAEALARRAQARAASADRYPTFSLTGRATATSDPLAAFGMRLQERDVTAEDFAPGNLNFPGVVGSVGFGAEAQLPLYTGGRLGAASEASSAQSAAAEAEQRHRRQQLALAVVAAYFGAQLAGERLQFAQESLANASDTEQFVEARVERDLLLRSEAARASAFRAQAQAELAGARQQVADARDQLVLLVGEGARNAELTSPAEAVPAPAESAGVRADVEAARHRESAARAQLDVVRSGELPQFGLQVSAGTLWGGGSALGGFATAALAGRWDFLAPARSAEADAARQMAASAAQMRRWAESEAATAIDKARRAVDSAQARVAAEREALEAAVTARDLRRARHREGLVPLTDLLDAEAAVLNAHLALLDASFAHRFSHAQLAFALGQAIEGVTR